MRLQIIAGALTLARAAVALSDSSPWALLSTSKFQDASNRNEIQTSAEVLKHTRGILSTCPTDRYLIVTQPGVHAASLRRANGCSMPHFCQAVKDSRIQGHYTVAEVVGDVKDARMAEYIRSACDEKNKVVTVNEVALASLSFEDGTGTLSENDAMLASDLEAAAKSDSYTILFFSTPVEPTYDPEFIQPVHMDLKRDLHSVPVRRQGNGTQRDTRPLFEKYQFFTPGVFMGIVVTLVLLTILGVGLTALSSLEVSYGAFEKEMGPAAQRKQ